MKVAALVSVEGTPTKRRGTPTRKGTPRKPKVVIVGAGMSGLYCACLLGDLGYQVTVLEKRPDPRTREGQNCDNRSINFTLSYRGLSALEKIGLRQTAIQNAVEVGQRLVHLSCGVVSRQSYRSTPQSSLYSITRNELGLILLNATEKRPTVQVHFDIQALKIDRDAPVVTFSRHNTQSQIEPDFVIGADGAFSSTRGIIQKGVMADYQQEFFDWVYKEFTLTSEQIRQIGLEFGGVHIWARSPVLLLGLPNSNGSLTCNLIVPRSADFLETSLALKTFIAQHFSELSLHAHSIANELLARHWSGIMTLKTRPWSYKDKMVLVGDSCHAVVHFYAQGLNASLEDCVTLINLLEKHEDQREIAFMQYEEIRKKNTDALSELSKENFVILSSKSASPFYEAKALIETWLARRFPRHWRTLYSLIAHSGTPYVEARKVDLKQRRFWKYSGLAGFQALLGCSIAIRRWVIRQRALRLTPRASLRERKI